MSHATADGRDGVAPEDFATAMAQLIAANQGIGPAERIARLHALLELSRLDTETLQNFAAFVVNTGLGSAKKG